MSDAWPPAGWFPDPEVPTDLRSWDGTAWSGNRRQADLFAVPEALQHVSSSFRAVRLSTLPRLSACPI